MRTGYKLILATLLVSLFLLSVIPGQTSAIPYKIQGYLKDSSGNPIPQANISISGDRLDPMTGTLTPSTYWRETDANGYYVIYVAGMEPDGFPQGSTMTISYDSGTSSVSTTITVEGLGAWGNLTYDPSGLYLARIVITPSPVKMEPSSSVVLTAQGYDQNGGKISCTPTWNDPSGNGVFTDALPGNPATVRYTSGEIEISGINITATDHNIVGSVKLTVKESGLSEILFSGTGIILIVILIATIVGVAFIYMNTQKREERTKEQAPAPKRVDRRRRQR